MKEEENTAKKPAAIDKPPKEAHRVKSEVSSPTESDEPLLKKPSKRCLYLVRMFV